MASIFCEHGPINRPSGDWAQMSQKIQKLQELLLPAIFPQSTCVAALERCRGNIAAAARELLDPMVTKIGSSSGSMSHERGQGTNRILSAGNRRNTTVTDGISLEDGSRPGPSTGQKRSATGSTLSKNGKKPKTSVNTSAIKPNRPTLDPRPSGISVLEFEIISDSEEEQSKRSNPDPKAEIVVGQGRLSDVIDLAGSDVEISSTQSKAKLGLSSDVSAAMDVEGAKPGSGKRSRTRSPSPPIGATELEIAAPSTNDAPTSQPTTDFPIPPLPNVVDIPAPPPISSARPPSLPSAFTLLRPPPTSIQPKKNLPQPPIIIPADPSRVPFFLPTCTLESSPLSQEQASGLYLSLLDEVRGFDRPKWFLNGRLVESPHTHAFYRLSEKEGGLRSGGEYWYAGRPEPAPPDFPPLLRKAVSSINPFVNRLLAVRARRPLELEGEWEANVAAVNHYEGSGSGVGWHADQLTHLGPCTTIVSLSLGTPRGFRLRPSASLVDPTLDAFGKPLRTYEIVLRHNSLFIMHALTQEYYKHTIPVQNKKSLDLFKPGWDVDEVAIPPELLKGYNSRINVTFRMYRKDFPPVAEAIGMMGVPREGTPVCTCGVPCILRADQKGKARKRRDEGAASSLKLDLDHVQDDPHRHGFGQDMAYFWMCNSGQMTGEVKGCGFFRLLDMQAEGRGPCIGSTSAKAEVVA